MGGRFSTEGRVDNVDKLFDGIMVVMVLILSLYVVPAMFLVQSKAMLW